MEPPPLPSISGRFRLRVQIYPQQEAYNLNAAPLRQFTIVKTPVLALLDLTLQELCDEVVKRFKVIYPGESLFAIDKPQDSYGSDLYLGDRVRDVFEDNEVFRIIKGASIRSSVEPHRARSHSIQPKEVLHNGSEVPGKRSYGQSETEDSLRAQKRQRIVIRDPDLPIHSSERDTVEREIQIQEADAREATLIQDSQKCATEDRARRDINRHSPEITKPGRMNSNPVDTLSASHQHIPTPPSIISSRNEAATSDSDAHYSLSRAVSRLKRKLDFIDDYSEQDRGHSISTAVTTPLSVLQKPKNQSPISDNKKLRRPTARNGKDISAVDQTRKILPHQNLYEVIETDTERASVKPVSQDVLSKISNSVKWRMYRSSGTPSSGKSSPHQRQNVVTKESNLPVPEDRKLSRQQTLVQKRDSVTTLAKQRADQERCRLVFEAADKMRLETDQKEKECGAKLEGERVAAEKIQKEIQVKNRREKEEAEAKATRRKEALDEVEAARASQLIENSRQEDELKGQIKEQKKAMLEKVAKSKAASKGGMLQLEIEALKRAEEENDRKEKAVLQSRQENRQKSEALRASLEATVRRRIPTKAAPASNGQFAAEIIPQTDFTSAKCSTGPAMSSNKRITCTPFIPRGRPSESSLASPHPSQTAAGSLPKLPSPNVGLEDQMPMPVQLKRKVSFVDQAPPTVRRTSSLNSTMKQTTLVPPRLGITDVKSTPKHNPSKMNSNASKSLKGKAKVMESPGKPPTPTIEISSDDEPALQHSRLRGVSSAGPAYPKLAARQVLSSPRSNPFTNVVNLDETANDRRGLNEFSAENTGTETSSSLLNVFINPVCPTPRNNKKHSTPEHSPSSVRSSSSLTDTPPNSKPSQSQHDSPAQSHSLPELANTVQPMGSKQVDLGTPRRERSIRADDDSEDELDSIDTPDALRSTDIPSSVIDQDDAAYLKDHQSEITDDEVEEDSESDGSYDPTQPSAIPKLIKNQENTSRNSRTDIEKKSIEEEEKELSDDKEVETQDESANEEHEEYSDAVQAQVDDQLLTQSFRSSSCSAQASSIIDTSKVLLAIREPGHLQNPDAGRPSLRRMNLEAQRTKEANLQAAKARGLEKAQTCRGSTKSRRPLEVSSGEDPSSEFSSTSSEYETDDDELVTVAESKMSGATNATENHGDLNNDDVDEMSQQLLAKSGNRKVPSAATAAALISLSKRSELKLRPTMKVQHNGDEKDGKTSAKIGWAKLGKQFSASKHKSRV